MAVLVGVAIAVQTLPVYGPIPLVAVLAILVVLAMLYVVMVWVLVRQVQVGY
jgi:hypothetical protein